MATESLITLRVDQIGSLARPQELIDACTRHDQGELSDKDLSAAQDQAIRATLARQEAMDSRSCPMVNSDGTTFRIVSARRSAASTCRRARRMQESWKLRSTYRPGALSRALTRRPSDYLRGCQRWNASGW